MDPKPIKLVSILTKNPALSFQEFQDYYENKHCKTIKLIPGVQRYFRRYLQTLPGGTVPFSEEPVFTAMAELWFNSREDLEFALRRSADPEIANILVPDEKFLFDREKMRIYTVDERF
ncbi:conserved hypothetical protein [Sphingobium faniae]|nr:conserved hypothetical protein [Sphingobium faniae]